MPPYFNQIGLDSQQREAIALIRAKHMERITALQKLIEREEEQITAESETV